MNNETLHPSTLVRVQVLESSTNTVLRDVPSTPENAEALAAEMVRNMDPFKVTTRVLQRLANENATLAN